MRILVVDDEPQILEVVRRYLERDGFEVLGARDGATALELARQGVDLVILDVMMPGGPDGLEVTRTLRYVRGSHVPILILSARDEEADRVTGLEVGADDYLTKPFSPRELAARVKALLRRSRMAAAPASGLHVDLEARRVQVDGEFVDLTPREYDLLKTLWQAPGKNFTREELLDRVWGVEYLGDTRRVDVHVSKLREKLSRSGRPAPIRSIWGVGYRLEP